MICEPCKVPGHRPEVCRDGTGIHRSSRWCDCQHMPIVPPPSPFIPGEAA